MKTRQRLNCYAPGNGSLDFVWLEGNVAANRRVTMSDARRWLKTVDGRKKKEEGWIVMKLNGLPTLVSHVERISDDVVEIVLPRASVDEPVKTGRFTYGILPDQAEWLEKKMLNINSIEVTTVRDGREIEVQNWGIKARIAHYLNYENEIVAWREAMRFKEVFGA